MHTEIVINEINAPCPCCLIVSVHATVDGRNNAGMVVAYDGIHAKRHGTGSPDFGTRVVDGNSDRRRKRTVVVTGRHYDGQNRAENFRVLDGADNAGRLDTDTGRPAGKSLRFIFPSPRHRDTNRTHSIGKRVVTVYGYTVIPVVHEARSVSHRTLDDTMLTFCFSIIITVIDYVKSIATTCTKFVVFIRTSGYKSYI